MFWAAAKVIPTSIAAVVANNLFLIESSFWQLLSCGVWEIGAPLAYLTGQPVSARSVPRLNICNSASACAAKAGEENPLQRP
jgi:hypothetical protein